MQNGSKPKGGIFKKLLLVFVGFIALFETVPRFVEIPGLEQSQLRPAYLASEAHRKFGPHPYFVLAPKPGDYGGSKERPGKKIFHNAAGFRGRELPLKKPDGTRRIACIGGSSTYGTGPSLDEFTWPARLEKLLAETGPFEVINGGTPSWTSFEALNMLAFRVLPYAPDIVLIYLGTNDAEAAMWPDPKPDNSHYREGWPTFRQSPMEPVLEKSMLYLTWRRYATDYLNQRADVGSRTKVVPGGKIGESLKQLKVPAEMANPSATGFANFQRNLVSMIAIAAAHGAQPVLVTQGLFSKGPKSDDLTAGAVRTAVQNRMTEIVRAVASERGVPLVDMEPILEAAAEAQVKEKGAQTIFVESVHLTDEGTELMATTLRAELVRIGVL